MQIAYTKAELRSELKIQRTRGLRIGLVPTMGALHEGHLKLVDLAKTRCDFVVLSIFVNPMQFAAHEDLSKYPRPIENDLAVCKARGVSLVFAPNADEMYGEQPETHVEVERVTLPLEGVHRPTHFRGVATVVCKLFNLVGESVAVFGRKDYQQYRTIAAMVRDLDMPIELVAAPTVRESDGLAMSSRNRYLSPSERVRALAIVDGMRQSETAFARGEHNRQALVNLTRACIEKAFDSIDYVEARDPETLQTITETNPKRILLVVAAKIGNTRLIDNVVLGEELLPR